MSDAQLLHGISVSSDVSNVDWRAAQKSFRFAYVRAARGAQVDEACEKMVAVARAMKLTVGLYLEYEDQPAEHQFEAFIRGAEAVRLRRWDLAPAIVIPETYGGQVHMMMETVTLLSLFGEVYERLPVLAGTPQKLVGLAGGLWFRDTDLWCLSPGGDAEPEPFREKSWTIWSAGADVDPYRPSELRARTLPTLEADPPERVLRTPLSGPDVALLQKRLGEPADGVFGPSTKAAVTRFQRSQRIRETGIVGALTLAALEDPAPPTIGATGDSKPPNEPPKPAETQREGEPANQILQILNLPPVALMLSDAAVRGASEDLLGYSDYAVGLAEVIKHDDLETPFTLAINAPWGAGKTSLANLLEEELATQREKLQLLPHVFCRFNAWMHDDAPKLGTAFAAEVARTAQRHRPRWRRLISPAPNVLLPYRGSRWRRNLLWLVFGLLAVALIGYAVLAKVDHDKLVQLAKSLSEEFGKWVDDKDNANWSATFGGAAALVFLVVKIVGAVAPAASAVGDFVRSPETAASEGTLREIAEQLGKLIHEATRGKRRFVIFVDDLERCEPPRAIDVLEVVNQLVAHRDVVTIVLADMPAVTACAEIKYKELSERYAPNDGLAQPPPSPADPSTKKATRGAESSYGRLYIQKIVQLQFDLPPLDRDRLKKLAKTFTKKAEAPSAPPASPGVLGDAGARVLGAAKTVVQRSSADWLRLFGPPVLGAGAIAAMLRSGWFVWLPLVAVGLSLMPIADALEARLRRRETAKVNERVRQAIDKGVELTPEAIEAEVAAAGVGDSDRTLELIRQRSRQIVVDESAVRALVEAILTDYIAPLPRYAKRAINRSRLALTVAFKRNLLGVNPSTVAAGIGKWVCLLERWPDLAQQLISNPAAMLELEQAARKDDSVALSAALSRTAPSYVADSTLAHLLKREPPLASWLEQLIRFDPEAPASQRKPSTDVPERTAPAA